MIDSSLATLAAAIALPFALTLVWRRAHGVEDGVAHPTGPRPAKPHKRLRWWAAAFVAAGAGAHRAVTAPGAQPHTRAAAALSYAALAAAATAAWPPLFFFTHHRVSRRAAALAAAADVAALAATAGTALLAFQAADPGGRAAVLLLPLLAGLAFAGVLANGAAAAAAVPAAGDDDAAATAAAEALVARAHRLGGLRPGSAALAAEAEAALRRRRRRRRGHGGGGGGGGGPGPAPPPTAGGPAPPPPTTTKAAPRANGAAPAVRPSVGAGPRRPPAPTAPTSSSLPAACFCDPGAAGFRVRSATYLADGSKVAPPATAARLAAVELVRLDAPVQHIARYLPAVSRSPAPFTLVWQVSVPGRGGALSLTAAWSLDYCPLARAEAAVCGALTGRPVPGPRVAVRPPPGLSPVPPVGGAAAAAAPPPPPPTTTEDGGGPWWRPGRAPGGGGGGRPDPAGDADADDARAAAAAGAAAASAAAVAVERSAVSATDAARPPGAAAGAGHRRAATAVNGDALAAAAAAATHHPPPPRAGPAPSSPPSPPARPWWADHLHAASPSVAGLAPFDLALARFVAGVSAANPSADASTARAGAFKIIPRLTDGAGWVLQRAVGQNTPCLLATKIDATYHAGPRHFEVDVDVGSSRTAAHVVGLVQGAVRGLVIDIALLVQGNEEPELPEALVGVVRLDRVDLAGTPRWAPGEEEEEGG